MGKSFLIISCKAPFCLDQMKVFQPTDTSLFLVFDSALALSRAIIIWCFLGACGFQQCKCNVKLEFSLMNAAFCVFSLLENKFEPWGTAEGKISSLSFKSHSSLINAFPLLADLFLKRCPVLSDKPNEADEPYSCVISASYVFLNYCFWARANTEQLCYRQRWG